MFGRTLESNNELLFSCAWFSLLCFGVWSCGDHVWLVLVQCGDAVYGDHVRLVLVHCGDPVCGDHVWLVLVQCGDLCVVTMCGWF